MLKEKDLPRVVAEKIHIVAPKVRLLLHKSGVYNQEFFNYIQSLYGYNFVTFEPDVTNKTLCYSQAEYQDNDQAYQLVSNGLSEYFSQKAIEDEFFNNTNIKDFDNIFKELKYDSYERGCPRELFRLLTRGTFNVYLVNVTQINNNCTFIKF